MAQWPCSGGARARPGSAVPDPGFGLEFGAVAVPVDEREAVVLVAGYGQDTGIAEVPAAVGDHFFWHKGRVLRLHRQTHGVSGEAGGLVNRGMRAGWTQDGHRLIIVVCEDS
jgi:hypothetical protein